MKCLKCGNAAFQSTTTEAIELGENCLLVIRNIPCFKCRECDEVLFTGEIVQRLEQITEDAKRMMQQLVIVDYAKVA